MKSILVAVILFLCGLFFLLLQAKNQSFFMENVVQGYKQQKQQDQQVAVQVAQHNKNVQNLTRTFASEPIAPSKVNSRKYNHFFEASVLHKGKIFRWNKSNLTYYINKMASRRLSKSKVRKAFSHWSRKSKNMFTFREVNNPNAADIFVRVATASEKNRMGEAGPDKSYRGKVINIDGNNVVEYIIHHAQVTIAADFFDIKSTENYRRTGKDHGFQTLVHELGHVLGLIGHSPKVGDCMYFQADSSARACDILTPEINTLAMIYGKPKHFTRGFYQQRRSY